MFSWFGKKEANKVIDGVGGWIDEQQLTKEEQVKYKFTLLEKMEPFKIVQRILVSIIMSHWAAWGLNCFVALWVGYLWGDAENKYELFNMLVGYAKLEMVWGPTIGAVSIYLGGGLKFFKNK